MPHEHRLTSGLRINNADSLSAEMSGVVFVVCIPTANFEQVLMHGYKAEQANQKKSSDDKMLCVEINLRDKHPHRIPITLGQIYPNVGIDERISSYGNNLADDSENSESPPMEKILDELLKKLEVEHVVWCGDKKGNYYEVFFPVSAGDPCENLLHCLTKLGIGKKCNSVVSVLPCSVVYSGLQTEVEREEIILRNTEERKQWNSFVESVRSKLTVKQVVDGVRSGGKMSFDYLLLIVTADCLAALGLVENNSPNIVAAMLVSPLMGPVMSITFGTIISDRSLQKSGFISLVVGMFISCLFGFIFGLILGSTEMPWGFGDWPTEEMKGRGNVRALWMGVLWALTSGSGVAVALLQGSAGPLIGVAISASLLPPVVNCGLYWALACIWLLHKGVKIPHINGESYYGNSSYVPLYSDYIPIEFAVNGIVSACLTIVNVICIFITAIIVLKIKEVAAPYTSSADLRRFWQQDLRVVRESNRASMRAAEDAERKEYMMEDMANEEINDKLDEAVKEAMDDDTFRKVQRVSYQTHGLEDVGRLLLNQNQASHPSLSRSCSFKTYKQYSNTANANDLATLDKLITTLLNSQSKETPVINRFKSKSFRSKRGSMMSNASSIALPTIMENNNRESSGNDRSTSWSESVFNHPVVSNVLQNLRQTTQLNDNTAQNPLINKESINREEC